MRRRPRSHHIESVAESLEVPRSGSSIGSRTVSLIRVECREDGEDAGEFMRMETELTCHYEAYLLHDHDLHIALTVHDGDAHVQFVPPHQQINACLAHL